MRALHLLPFALLLSLSGCDGCNGEATGGTGGGGAGGGGSGGSGGGGAGGAGGGGTGGVLFGGQGGMLACGADGAPCNMGTGVCAGDVCCEPSLACGATCCAAPAVCSFQACVAPGGDCVDADDCAPGEYCETSLGAPPDPPQPGCTAALPTGKCLPKPPICPNGQEPDPQNPECLAACQLVPPSIPFAPALTYAWGGQTAPPYASDVMMTPIVLELDDDDCDGLVTARDIPEIVFTTFSSGGYGGTGVLHAISVEGGVTTELWSLAGIHPTKQLAGGDLDGLPGNEIVACGNDGTLKLVSATGQVLWSTPVATCFMPSVANLDQQGGPEIVIEDGIYDGATGALLHSFAVPLASSFVLSDADGDGLQDVVTGSQVFHADGSLVTDTGVANVGSFYGTQDWKSPWPAVGDFDLDGKPEVVVVDNLAHTLSVWRVDAGSPGGFAIVRGPVDLQGPNPPPACAAGTWGATHGGGPPTVADFNGDGVPDVATAGGVGYAVFDGAKLVDPMTPADQTILWIFATVDCSSASTGSTVFDFDGDGRAEVVYSDQQKLRIFDGPTGNVLAEICNTTATLIENPVVADVDGDGHADIVAVSNAYGYTSTPQLQCDDGSGGVPAQSGVRVFGDPTGKWVRTRRVWNEHGYHVTNVNEDGSIPLVEAPNWTAAGLNNFRQNKQPGSEFAAPDAVVSVAPSCENGYALFATVRNLGEAALPAGVVVGFYQGLPPNGVLLGTGVTQLVLYPAQAEVVTFQPASPIDGALVYAVVDDGGAPHPSWAECRTDNNVSDAVSSDCFVPN